MALQIPKPRVTMERIESLEPYPGNPNRGDVDSIGDSVDANGWYGAVVVQTSTRRILAGHHRIQAAVERGAGRVPVVWADVDDAAARRIVVGDNQIPRNADTDDTDLAALLGQMQDDGGGLAGTGYAPNDLDQLLRSLEPPVEDAGRQDVIPAPPLVPRTKPGEVIELGRHRLVCGDAHDPEALTALFGDVGHADIAFTDPPYAIYGSSSGISSSVTDDRLVVPSFRAILNVLASRLPEFAPAYVCCDWRSWAAWWEAARQTKMSPKNALVWDKGGYGMGSNWFNCYELVGYYLHLPAEKTMTSSRRRGICNVQAANVLHYPRPAGDDRHHNAAKPVAMIRHVLEVTAKGLDHADHVFDPFAGSGSTMFAADQAGMSALMVEIDPAWCDVIRDRYETLGA